MEGVNVVAIAREVTTSASRRASGYQGWNAMGALRSAVAASDVASAHRPHPGAR